MFIIQKYNQHYYNCIIEFLKKCLPQSGRNLDLNEQQAKKPFRYMKKWDLYKLNNIIQTIKQMYLWY